VSGANLPVNIDATYADSATDPSVELHQLYHDLVHKVVNLFDKDSVATSGQVLAWNTAVSLYQPVTPGTSPASASTTVQGIVELADNTETQTGTDATRAVTPAGLAARVIGFANALPGSTFYVTSADASVTWQYNGATVSARPTSRADLIMVARTAGTTGPSFAITGWDLLERAGS
jgi:hypothetical protein